MEKTKMDLLKKVEEENQGISHNDVNNLRKIIEESVDDSVKRAFKKYGRNRFAKRIIGKAVSVLLIVAIVVGGLWWWKSSHNVDVASLANHDLTLENHGLFGYKAVDFSDVILGEAKKQKLLIVEERDASVNTTVTEAGFLKLGIFSKKQIMTIHGTGEYTIDLAEVTEDDISLNEDTYELTITIPQPVLHTVDVNVEETEIGDVKKGWLAFGDIKMTAEQTKEFQTEAEDKLKKELSTDECLEEANRYAKMVAYETYQPLVSGISPVYKVVIVVEEEE